MQTAYTRVYKIMTIFLKIICPKPVHVGTILITLGIWANFFYNDLISVIYKVRIIFFINKGVRS